MAHAGLTKSFLGMFKETSLAFFFDIGGLFAGFMLATQFGIFEKAPWVIALYPAMVSAKGVINGLLSGRLGTALHLGTIHPKFFGNTKSFYKLIESLIVLTVATSTLIGIFSIFFGPFFWGTTIADFPTILAVLIATMGTGLFITLITIKVAFISFKRGLDPDIVVYPVMSTIADILITLLYIGMLYLYFSGFAGPWIIAILSLIIVILVLYLIPKNRKEPDFIRTLKESIVTMVFVAFMVNVTGTILERIHESFPRQEIINVYPALIDMIGDVGSVVGSTATTKLALGLLTPSYASIKKHSKNIFSAWASSLMMFAILAVLALIINGIFSFTSFSTLIAILLIANVIAVTMIVVLSYGISILTFKRGLDPDNFVIPVESTAADSITTLALLIALTLIL